MRARVGAVQWKILESNELQRREGGESEGRSLTPIELLTGPQNEQCTELYSTLLHCTLLCCTLMHCNTLHFTVLYYTVLQCTVLHYTVLYCTILYSTVLYCTVLYFNALYRALYTSVECISRDRPG